MAKKEDTGKKENKKSISTKKSDFYKISGSSVSKLKRECPKCGPAIFMADHKDRFHCGKCGFAEFKKTSGA